MKDNPVVYVVIQSKWNGDFRDSPEEFVDQVFYQEGEADRYIEFFTTKLVTFKKVRIQTK